MMMSMIPPELQQPTDGGIPVVVIAIGILLFLAWIFSSSGSSGKEDDSDSQSTGSGQQGGGRLIGPKNLPDPYPPSERPRKANSNVPEASTRQDLTPAEIDSEVRGWVGVLRDQPTSRRLASLQDTAVLLPPGMDGHQAGQILALFSDRERVQALAAVAPSLARQLDNDDLAAILGNLRGEDRARALRIISQGKL